MKGFTDGQLRKLAEKFGRTPSDVVQKMLREKGGLLDLVARCDWERRDMELVRQGLPQRVPEASVEPRVRERASGVVEVTLDPTASFAVPDWAERVIDAEQYLLRHGVHALEPAPILGKRQSYMDGEDMLKRARRLVSPKSDDRPRMIHCPYGARSAEAFYAERGRFPRWWLAKGLWFSFPAVVIVERDTGYRFVRVVYPNGGEWILVWHWLGYDWYRHDRFPRSR